MMRRFGLSPVRSQKAFVRYYGFIVMMGIFVLGIVVSTVYVLHRLHEEAIEAQFAFGAMYARTFEDHLTQSCLFIDRTLVSHVDEMGAEVSPETIGRSFKSALRHMPYLRSLSLLNARGTILASSNAQNIGRSVGMADYVPAIAEAGSFLRVGRPWLGRDFADGRELSGSTTMPNDNLGFIPLMRTFRVKGVAYALVATLNPDYFVNYYRQMLNHDQDVVEWLRYDGVPLLTTSEHAFVGDYSGNKTFISSLGEREFGKFESAKAGQSPSLVSFRASRLFPLVVVTHIDRNRALASWQKERQRLLLVVLPSLFLVVVVSVLLYRRQRRLQAEQIEAERREHEKLAATIFATVAEAVLATDAHGRIVVVNPALARVTGYTTEELIGQTPAIFASGSHAPAFFREMWDALKQRGFWDGEICNRRKDGRPWIVWIAINCVRDGEGAVTHYVAGYTDITERKQMEESLRFAKECAESASRAKGEFLANMSHEIRTPMNAIIGLTGLALEDCTEPRQLDLMRKVYASSRALLGILNDILDYSKMEAGCLTIEELPLRVEELRTRLLDLFGAQAQQKDLCFKVDVAPDVPPVLLGDSLRLGQVLANLVGNAIKFTEQGEVCVAIGLVGIDDGKASLSFSVSDTGIGLSEEQSKGLFRAFSQADSSITRKYGGTGLGLAISDRLVRLMGGKMTLHSLPQRGTTFTFTLALPCPGQGQDAGWGHPPPTWQNTLRFEKAHILLVEDNLLNQQVAREMLERRGASVCLAENGAIALEWFQKEKFDLVLMDLHMPVMDGYEAASRLRSLPGGSDVPIIAMTAAVLAEDRERCTALGMVDFIAKPIEPSELMATLGRWVRVQSIQQRGYTVPVQTIQNAELAGFDLNGAVRRLDGDKETLLRLLQHLSLDYSDALMRVEQSLAQADPKAATELLHAIKGAAANLGATALSNAAAQLEAQIQSGQAGVDGSAFGKVLETTLAAIARGPALFDTAVRE